MGDQGSAQMTRREALGRVASVGTGAAVALARGLGSVTLEAQLGGVQAIPPAPDPRFPKPPTWERELKELAPGVYSYIQAGGPGRDNVSVSDAGLIVGDEGVMIIDTLAAP